MRRGCSHRLLAVLLLRRSPAKCTGHSSASGRSHRQSCRSPRLRRCRWWAGRHRRGHYRRLGRSKLRSFHPPRHRRHWCRHRGRRRRHRSIPHSLRTHHHCYRYGRPGRRLPCRRSRRWRRKPGQAFRRTHPPSERRYGSSHRSRDTRRTVDHTHRCRSRRGCTAVISDRTALATTGGGTRIGRAGSRQTLACCRTLLEQFFFLLLGAWMDWSFRQNQDLPFFFFSSWTLSR